MNQKKLIKLGTDYGSWVVPLDILNEKSICYSAGVGEDISFDVALIEMFGCPIYLFDPTPKAKEHISKLKEKVAFGEKMKINEEEVYSLQVKDIGKLNFFDYGLYGENTTLKFYFPADPHSASYSMLENWWKTSTYFEAPCKKLSTIMKELGHKEIDLLKIDIEGAEVSVLKNMLQESLKPKILCIELDNVRFCPLTQGIKQVMQLVNYGYEIVDLDDWNFTFIARNNLHLLDKCLMLLRLSVMIFVYKMRRYGYNEYVKKILKSRIVKYFIKRNTLRNSVGLFGV